MMGYLIAGCASSIPGYKLAHDDPIGCYAPQEVEGMHRIHPSAAQVTEAWSALDLKGSEYIEYWAEDGKGNVLLEISDGSRHWEVKLTESIDSYTSNNKRWREEEVICIG